MKKLTISIVNYNSGEYLLKCLESIGKVKNDIDFDVFIIDNASSDDSFKNVKFKYPQYNFIENSKNLGFGKAQNIVLKKSKTPYLLTLNPDTQILPDTLSFMINFMEENNDVGASGCKVEMLDGSLDKASHRGFPTLKASFYYFLLKNDKYYHLTYKNMNEIHEVDSVSGAFMLLRKSVLDKIGYFDEDYFLYAEDIDLCLRIKKDGFKVMYVPKVKVTHAKGISSGIKINSIKESMSTNKTKNLALDSFYKTMKIFYKKHYEKDHFFLVNWLVYLGIDFKWNMAKRNKTV